MTPTMPGVCEAQVGESGDLAAARLEERAAPASRILTEPLATFPVFAATPASDPQWSAIVAWAIYALQRAELPATPWTAAGVKSAGRRGARPRPRRRLGQARCRRRRLLRRHLCAQSRRRLASQASARSERAGRTRRPVRHALIANRRRHFRVRFGHFQRVAAPFPSHVLLCHICTYKYIRCEADLAPSRPS